MDWSIILGLIFSGICTIEAIFSIGVAIKVYGRKKEIDIIKNEIDSYRNDILEKNDLAILLSKIEIIKGLEKTFGKISTKVIPQPGDEKDEIQYYGTIKNNITEVMNDIPSEYRKVRKLIKEVKEALGYCISNSKKFNELSLEDKYSYQYVEAKFEYLLDELNKLTREMRFN